MEKQLKKEAILTISLVNEANEIDSEVIKKDILRDSFIPWSKEIISVQGVTMTKEDSLKEKTENRINISSLKSFALKELPKDSPLREILLAESEEIDVSIFLARLPIWLQLSKFKRCQQ